MIKLLGYSRPSLTKVLGYFVVAAVFVGVLGSPHPVPGQTPADAAANTAWQPAAIAHAQNMRAYKDADSGAQPTPPVIPPFTLNFDASGMIATVQPGGATQTSRSPFFQNLGTNGRTCFTCHQPQTGWTISAQSVQARFYSSAGADPIFRLVDGATCPTADVSTLDAKTKAYSLLLSKGLIRIGLPMPATAEFKVLTVQDPYGCTTNPATGLTSPTTGIVSVYRRPLPATNLGFLSAIMWDGREPSLASQAVDATLGHAQANAAPTPAQQQQIVNFETGLFTAQGFDNNAKDLGAAGATGGPGALPDQLAGFYIGINDPLGQNPTGAPFTPEIFDLYRAWTSLGGAGRGDRVPRVGRPRRGALQYHTHHDHGRDGLERRAAAGEYPRLLWHVS